MKRIQFQLPKSDEVCVIVIPGREPILIYRGSENGRAKPEIEADEKTEVRYERLTED